MKRRLLARLAMTAAFVVPIAACSDSDRMDDVAVTPPAPPPPTATPAPPPPGPAATAIESLGTRFAAIFRTDSNTEPTDPAEGDIVPISFTTEPTEITTF